MLVLLSWTTITAPRFRARPKAAAREQSDEPFCLPPRRGSSSIDRSAARHGTAPVAALGEHRGASPRGPIAPSPVILHSCVHPPYDGYENSNRPEGSPSWRAELRAATLYSVGPHWGPDHATIRFDAGLRGGGSILADGAKARVLSRIAATSDHSRSDYPGRVIGAEALKSLLNLVMRIISSREVRHRAEPHPCGPDATAR